MLRIIIISLIINFIHVDHVWSQNNEIEIESGYGAGEKRRSNTPRTAKLNGKYGFVDGNDKVIIPCIYKYAEQFTKSDQTTKVTNFDNLVGIIDRKGKIVFPFKYYSVYNFNAEKSLWKVSITPGGNSAIVTAKGEIVLDTIFYEFRSYDGMDISYAFIFDKKLKKYNSDVAKFGFVNSVGEIIMPAVGMSKGSGEVYQNVWRGRTTQAYTKNDQWRYYELGKGWLTDEIFDKTEKFDENGKSKVYQGSKIGFIDVEGNITWEKVDAQKAFVENMKERYDNYGKVINGYMKVKKGDKYGFADAKGKEIIPPIYQAMYDFHPNYSIVGVKKDNKFGYVNTDHKVVIPLIYDFVGQINDGLIFLKKDGKYGYANTKGEVVCPLKYDYAESFKFGKALVKSGGESYYINSKFEKVSKNSTYNNSIEMSFDFAESDGQKGHLGVIWDKKTGLNRVFQSPILYNYKFQGNKIFDLTPVQLAPLKDVRGEIMMQALQYGAGFSPQTFKFKILVWNTYSGKYIVFDFNQKTKKFEGEIVSDGSNLRDSWLKSEKGGRIMIDYLYFYQDGKKTRTKIIGWNTLTGKSTYGDIKIPNYNPQVDGEIMVESFLFEDGDVYSLEYTTKTLKKEDYDLAEKGDKKYQKSGVDFDVDKTSEHQVMFKYVFGKNAEMMIFEQNSLNNSTGLKRSNSLYLYNNLKFYKEDYSSLQRKYSDEIGVLQIGSHTGKKLEYMFWNKSSGHFNLFTYQKGSPSRFVPSVGVSENLLDLKAGTASTKVMKGEALTKYVAPKETNTTSSNSSSSSSSSTSSSSSPKLVQVQVNPNGKGKNFVHIHWTENGSSKKKSLQSKSSGSIGKIPEGTKLYYSSDNDSKKTFFYEVPTGKSNASVTIK